MSTQPRRGWLQSRTFRFLLVTHRWMGIPSSLLLCIIALSGAVLVYERPIDRLLNPTLYQVRPGDTRLSYDSLVTIATRARPREAPAGAIHEARRPDESVRVQFVYHQVFMDPYRGVILGERGIGQSLVHQMRVLHHSLLMEPIGRTITVIATSVCLLLALGGLGLWWPRRIIAVKRSGSWRRVNYDLHNVTGAVGAAGVVLFAGTAIAMQLTPLLDPIYRRAFGDAAPPRLAPPSAPAATPLSIDSLVRLGDAAVPGILWEIQLPPTPHGTLQVVKQTPGEHGNRARNMAFVDANDGRVRGVIDQNVRPMGTRISMRMEDWHIAAFAPPWSRVFGIGSCLLLAVSSLTGVLVWWKPKRRAPASD